MLCTLGSVQVTSVVRPPLQMERAGLAAALDDLIDVASVCVFACLPVLEVGGEIDARRACNVLLLQPSVFLPRRLQPARPCPTPPHKQTYIDAPNPASGPIPDDVTPFFQPPFYEWWNASRGEDGRWSYEGWEASVAHVGDVMKLHGPFDGVMGFSQVCGAAGCGGMHVRRCARCACFLCRVHVHGGSRMPPGSINHPTPGDRVVHSSPIHAQQAARVLPSSLPLAGRRHGGVASGVAAGAAGANSLPTS